LHPAAHAPGRVACVRRGNFAAQESRATITGTVTDGDVKVAEIFPA